MVATMSASVTVVSRSEAERPVTSAEQAPSATLTAGANGGGDGGGGLGGGGEGGGGEGGGRGDTSVE